MKKNLFYLFALICSMSLFTACSDDDEPSWKKLPSKEISDKDLTLTTNAQSFPNASVKLAMVDDQNGVLTLNNAVRGLNEIEINVTVAEQADGAFAFQGEKSVGSATKAVADLVSSTSVKVSGTINLNGTATVTVTTSASGSIVKKWQLCDKLIFDSENGVYAYAPFKLYWVSPYGEGGNSGIAAGNIQSIGTVALSSIMVKLLKDVEFKADGAIVANYAKDVEIDPSEIMNAIFAGLPSTDGVSWLTSPANLAYWYAADNHIYVALDVAAILAKAMAGSNSTLITPEMILGILNEMSKKSGAEIKETLADLIEQFGGDSILGKLDITKIPDADVEKLIGYVLNGFPLNYEISEAALENGNKVNNIYVYLDKSIFDIFMPAIYPMLPDLDTMVKELTMDMMGQQVPVWGLIQGLTGLNSLTEIEPLWKATTKFNIGLDLGNGSYKVAK